MGTQSIKSIVALIIGALVVFLLMKNCSGNNTNPVIETPNKTVVVKLTTKVDTLYVPKNIYVRVEVPIPGPTITDTIFIEDSKTIATIPAIRRVYNDSVKVLDSVTVGYTARTTGTLDNMQLTFRDKRAEKTIIRTNTIETTITNNIKPSGVYVGVGANLGLNILTPSIEYLNNKNKFGVYYNVAGTQTPLQNVGITYSRKLF